MKHKIWGVLREFLKSQEFGRSLPVQTCLRVTFLRGGR
jgi:hypothetical protein